MVLHHWHQSDLFNYLKKKGCIIITDDYPDITVFRGPSQHLVYVKHKRTYYHPAIIRICDDLGIKAPREFIKIKKQFDALLKACEHNPFLDRDINKN